MGGGKKIRRGAGEAPGSGFAKKLFPLVKVITRGFGLPGGGWKESRGPGPGPGLGYGVGRRGGWGEAAGLGGSPGHPGVGGEGGCGG